MTKEKVLAQLRENPQMMACLNGDGHGMYAPDWYTSAGWGKSFIGRLNRRHVSDGTVKGSLFDKDGNLIAEQTAVYSLEFHQAVAMLLGVDDWGRFFGRGSTARYIADEVRKMVEVPA